MFSTYTMADFKSIGMENKLETQIVSMGDVQLQADIECKILLTDIKHVFDICLNLISTGNKYHTLYRTEAQHITREINMVKATSSSKL